MICEEIVSAYCVSYCTIESKRTWFLKAAVHIKTQTPVQVSSFVNFVKFLRTTFYRHFWTTASGFFHLFFCFLPLSELRETRFFLFLTCFITYFKLHEYHEFCSWKTILCKMLSNIKTHRNTSTQKSLFKWNYMLEACNFIEKRLAILAWYFGNLFPRILGNGSFW